MDIEFANWLVEIDGGGTGATLVEGYSGLGTGGRTTTAVSTDDPVNLLLAAVREAHETPGDMPEMPDELMWASCRLGGGAGEVIY